MFNLRDYQAKAIEKLRSGWLSLGNTHFHPKQLLVLATGLGKTVVFSHIAEWVYRELGGHVLILAHREELLEQAEEKLATVMGLGEFQINSMIQREQGSSYAYKTPIISASVMTWGVNRGGGDFNERMSRFPRDYFKLIIIDECFTPDVEVLTSKGFVRFDQLQKSDVVAQFNSDTKKISYVEPLRLVKKWIDDDVVTFKSDRKIDVTVTKQHDMLLKSHGQFFKVKAEDLKNGNNEIQHAGFATGPDATLTPLEKLEIVFQADGHSNGRNHLYFSFSKERKIQLFLDLMKDGGFEFNEIKGDGGRGNVKAKRCFSVRSPDDKITKNLYDFFNVSRFSLQKCKDVIEYMVNWDGSKIGDDLYYYSSTNEQNASFYQHVAASCGYKTNKTVQIDDRSESFNNIHRLFIVKSTDTSTLQKVKKTTEKYSGYVYCATVPDGNLIVRRNGKVLVCGNCHHATSPSYQHILDYFNEAWVLGVTATPKRGDKVSLKNLFSREAFRMDIVDGMKAEWLCPVVAHRVSSKTDLSNVRTTAGDFNLKDLAAAVNNAARNDLVLEAYLQRCDASLSTGLALRQAIIFATDLDHARALSEKFREQGISSVPITGDMDKTERRQAIADFKSGKIKVLTNYGVLTEGFDYEDLDLIISARPTKSALLLTQILGRGTRWPKERMPNKKLDFVEIVDLHSDDTATAAQIFGFHQKFDCEGHDFLECIWVAEDMEKKKEYFSPWSSRSFSKMVADFTAAIPVFDPTKPRPDWFFDHRYRFVVTSGSNLILKHKETSKDEQGVESSAYYVMRVQESSLGGFEGSISEKKDGAETRLFVFNGDTRLDVVERIEAAILNRWPDWDILLNINAGWRKKAATIPCTDKQYNLIKKFRLDRGRTQKEITKAEATDILSRAFSR